MAVSPHCAPPGEEAEVRGMAILCCVVDSDVRKMVGRLCWTLRTSCAFPVSSGFLRRRVAVEMSMTGTRTTRKEETMGASRGLLTDRRWFVRGWSTCCDNVSPAHAPRIDVLARISRKDRRDLGGSGRSRGEFYRMMMAMMSYPSTQLCTLKYLNALDGDWIEIKTTRLRWGGTRGGLVGRVPSCCRKLARIKLVKCSCSAHSYLPVSCPKSRLILVRHAVKEEFDRQGLGRDGRVLVRRFDEKLACAKHVTFARISRSDSDCSDANARLSQPSSWSFRCDGP
eukprot:768693-Hanusia_phi.AAC.7